MSTDPKTETPAARAARDISLMVCATSTWTQADLTAIIQTLLDQEAAKARKDSERLDWIQQSNDLVVSNWVNIHTKKAGVTIAEWDSDSVEELEELGEGETLRQAIDAAMSANAPTESQKP